jgi:hypothetical protein
MVLMRSSVKTVVEMPLMPRSSQRELSIPVVLIKRPAMPTGEKLQTLRVRWHGFSALQF